MRVALFWAVMLSLGCTASAWSEQCEGGAAVAAASDSRAPASGLEYARGTPVTVDVEDSGEIKQLFYIRVGSQAVVEGDILIGDANQIAFAAQSGPIRLLYRASTTVSQMTPFGYVARSVLSNVRRWTDNTVPYVIDPRLGAHDLIIRSMKAWSDATKLKFVERTASNAPQFPNYVYFTAGTNPNACLSAGVGMVGGRQNVELVDGCGYGQIVHEIGHVIGLHHEQNRSDRDTYVRVDVKNILSGYAGQFKQRPSDFADAGTYDLDSIMHYEPYAFSCNGEPTIVPVKPLPPGTRLGQRDHLSQGDRAIINSIYK